MYIRTNYLSKFQWYIAPSVVKLKMSENNRETSIPSNFGAFIPVEEDSESIDEEEQIGKNQKTDYGRDGLNIPNIAESLFNFLCIMHNGF